MQPFGAKSPVVDEALGFRTEDPGQRPQAESNRLVTSATAAWLPPMPHSGWQGVPSRQRQVPADADAMKTSVSAITREITLVAVEILILLFSYGPSFVDVPRMP